MGDQPIVRVHDGGRQAPGDRRFERSPRQQREAPAVVGIVAAGGPVNVGTVDGGLRPNVIAPESRAVVDVRIARQADAERVDAAIRGLEPTSPGSALIVQGGIGRPALEPTPRNRALWRLARRLGDEIGLELTEAAAGGASDGNTTSLYTGTLDGLGPVGDGAHAHHEHLDIDLTIERTALLTLLLLAPPLTED